MCCLSKGSLNIPEYSCLLIGRVQYMYTIEHVVENIAYHRLQSISVTLLSLVWEFLQPWVGKYVYVMFPLKFHPLWVTPVCEPDLENEERYFLKCWSFGWKYEQLNSLVQLFSFSRIFSLEFKFQKFYFNFQLNFVELSLGVYWLKLYYFKRVEYIYVYKVVISVCLFVWL